ncbi:unnamed protein product [Ectocarpus sp. CCAP 1310/34]|nr:unnamed protein product [Ectocarpus sp. CCAP 1310/34]
MELIQAAAKVKGADQGGGGGGGGGGGDIEATIKTCCDNVQTRIQQEFDRNIDILDRYIKKNVAAVAASVPFGPGATEAPAVAAAGEDGRSGNGAAPAAGGWGAGAAVTGAVAPAAAAAAAPGAAAPGAGDAQERSGGGGGGGGVGGGSSVAPSAKGGAVLGVDAWASEVEEGTPPKRLEEEEALDAEIQHLRKRRRQGLRRCAALVRRGARETVLLQDVKDFVDALQMGVSSSFDDNGLTPIPSKVQEAVQSCAELRVTADRAQALTRRLERQVEQSAEWGGGGEVGGGASSSAVASTVPPPRDLQSMFQRSSEQQVVAGSATEYSTLKTRLRG